MKKKLEKGYINWELEEYLINDKVYQDALKIYYQAKEIEERLDKEIDRRLENEKRLKDIFVKHYKDFTPQDIKL